jgi:hypothetical protein
LHKSHAANLRFEGNVIDKNEQGFVQVGYSCCVRPQPLLIKNMMMKLITKAQQTMSSRNQSLTL